ncbi:MAG TPA: methyltransferase domain-containing protein [Chloroflexi bacterium]|nr:methyltransferase domain-containing protein [Chloroflexota bacterium]
MREIGIFDGLATGYDRGMLLLEWAVLRGLRRRAFPYVKGRVLEMGVGTGINLPLYGPETQVVALDASGPMLAEATHRRTRATVRPVQADVQHLPFADGCLDAVTGSLLFCSVADPAQALAEVQRVLSPGGRLVLVEHTRGSGLGAWLTDVLHPLWFAVNGTCHLNRETVRAVAEAGFRLLRVETRLLGIFRIIEGETDRTPPTSGVAA